MWLKALTPVRYAPGNTAKEGGPAFELDDDAAEELLRDGHAEKADAPAAAEGDEKAASTKPASTKK